MVPASSAKCAIAAHAGPSAASPRNAEVGDGIAAVRAAFGPGERDLGSVPDFDKEAEGYKLRAAEYGARPQ